MFVMIFSNISSGIWMFLRASGWQSCCLTCRRKGRRRVASFTVHFTSTPRTFTSAYPRASDSEVCTREFKSSSHTSYFLNISAIHITLLLKATKFYYFPESGDRVGPITNPKERYVLNDRSKSVLIPATLASNHTHK